MTDDESFSGDASVRAPDGLPRFSYAFQPIVDVNARAVAAYEALIRGPSNEPAAAVLGAVPVELKYPFDEISRNTAIELAVDLGIAVRLNLNLLPRSLTNSTQAIDTTVEAATRCGLPLNLITIELTEDEVIADLANLWSRLSLYRASGVLFAIDDFGAGYSGLKLLTDFCPDEVKIDMSLIRGVDSQGPRQAVVRAINQACTDLGIKVVAEGVETVAEYEWLYADGICLFQGYLFSAPGFEHLPVVEF